MRCLLFFVTLWGGLVSAQVPADGLATAQRAATKAYVNQGMDLRGELTAMSGEVEALRGMIAMVQDPAQRGPLMAQVNAVANRLGRINGMGLMARPSARSALRPPEPVSSAALSRLENSLRAANFREDKVRVIREAAKSHFFSTKQVRTLTSHFSFGEDRVEVIAAVYPRLTDPENAHVLYELLSSREDREALERRLNP